MELDGFRRINEGEESAKAWRREVEQASGRGLTLTTLEVVDGRLNESTGNFEYEGVVVRDVQRDEVLGRFTASEFASVNYGREGWFDVNGPYEPQG